jgi:hypothetical protein
MAKNAPSESGVGPQVAVVGRETNRGIRLRSGKITIAWIRRAESIGRRILQECLPGCSGLKKNAAKIAGSPESAAFSQMVSGRATSWLAFDA